MVAVGSSPLAGFLSTSAKLKICTAAVLWLKPNLHPCPLQITVRQIHKTSVAILLCDLNTVSSPCLVEVFMAHHCVFRINLDLDGPTSHDARNSPDTTDTDNPGPNHVNPADAMDTDDSDFEPMDTDTSDAEAFQAFSRGEGLSTTANTGEIAVDEPADGSELAEHSIEFEAHFTDTSTVVIDNFPFGNPGAPIPGATQGLTLYDVLAGGDSIWAPFQSRRDWEVAHCIKTEWATASTMDRLLAVLQVCAARSFSFIISLTQVSRSPGFHIAR